MSYTEHDIAQIADAATQALVQLYTAAEKEILTELSLALVFDEDREYLERMLQNVRIILEWLKRGSGEWCKWSFQHLYEHGMQYADAQIPPEIRTQATAGFGMIHQQAAKVLAENTYNRLSDVTDFIGRRIDDIYREMALESVRGSIIGYKSWQDVAGRLQSSLARHGITGFVDKAGRQWNMETYAEMVARTSTMEAHLEGTKNRFLEHGYDLVIVSSHHNPCEKCRPWEDEILSLTGRTPGYPTLEESKEAGMWHPNCRHTYSLYTDFGGRLERLRLEVGEAS